MRAILSIITICVMSSGLWAQEKSFEKQVKEISDEITAITESEKSLLKAEVEVINKKVELGELTEEEVPNSNVMPVKKEQKTSKIK